ncbi:retropepsin-like aspartic protease family protein [Halodurantibacterium flavum]|uniref:TIGR02281 family clan AA aspartic protease n=1 Tax=Halodurantibacterium flavum TaxID=1382802 RepID=A0ABW4S4L1_9RHOB
MAGENTARLIYLVLLLAAIGGYVLLANRRQIGQMAQQAAIWLMIIVGLAAAWQLWSDTQNSARMQQMAIIDPESGQIEVPRAWDGHYYLTVAINGVPLRFLVDTGATEVVLSAKDARAAGFSPAKLNYYGQARTANGVVRTAPIRLERVELAGHVETNMSAWVNEGEMETSLLGMTYLSRFARIEITRDRMILSR